MAQNDNELDFLIGLTESAAFELVQEFGYVPRVFRKDLHTPFSVLDINMNRVNLYIEDNLVVYFHRG